MNRAAPSEAAVAWLADAIWARPYRAALCWQRAAWLPTYVAAETGGLGEGAEFLPIKRHLLGCEACFTFYVELLMLEVAAEAGRLPTLPPGRAGDLSFLTGGGEDGG